MDPTGAISDHGTHNQVNMNIMRANKNILRIFWVTAIGVALAACGNDITDMSDTDNTPGTPERGRYSFSITAGNETTRAVLDQGDYKYYWETGDQVGLIIVPAGSTTPIDPVSPIVKMTNDHAGLTDHATFSGELTQTQINAMSAGSTYDYYSYFPYGAGVVDALPEIRFTIPSTLSLKPDVFNTDYAPMVAQVETNLPPIVYQYGENVQHGSLIHFDYKHTMSYAAIEMDVNLLPQAITSITITNDSGTLICGSYSYNMANGSAGYVSGVNSITINIVGELYVGDGSVLYVPMPPVDMTGQNFTLTFHSGGSYANKYENVTTIPGINFEKGKIHRLRVAPAATYTETTSFTVTKSGYYYIEAWGGNGGSSSSGSYGFAAGGIGGVKRGLFYISAGTSFDVLIGMHGENAGGRRANAAGGTSGIGTGGNGARGGDHSLLGGNYGYAGGGGGGASGVRIGGTVRLAAGGGGGGGGTGEHNRANNSEWQPVHRGSDGSDSDSSSPPGNGASTGSPNGAGGQDGESGNAGAYNGGGGGGGGGGGYPKGGFGGPGGSRLGNLSDGDPRGGGAGGGMNYIYNAETNTSGYMLPTNNRPGDRIDGYIVITFIR